MYVYWIFLSHRELAGTAHGTVFGMHSLCPTWILDAGVYRYLQKRQTENKYERKKSSSYFYTVPSTRTGKKCIQHISIPRRASRMELEGQGQSTSVGLSGTSS
ncbi:hypothetical protein BaRGS_00032355 [Batillaria attramentaria]|uniref:Secreted protein n=1 Tax=Batillaria attramentaria TaxID=370345 RepID=A0ABD0JP48_9CAEN